VGCERGEVGVLRERGGDFEYLRLTVWHFIVALVSFHIERHSAFCAFETRFVPCLKREKETENVRNGKRKILVSKLKE